MRTCGGIHGRRVGLVAAHRATRQAHRRSDHHNHHHPETLHKGTVTSFECRCKRGENDAPDRGALPHPSGNRLGRRACCDGPLSWLLSTRIGIRPTLTGSAVPGGRVDRAPHSPTQRASARSPGPPASPPRASSSWATAERPAKLGTPPLRRRRYREFGAPRAPGGYSSSSSSIRRNARRRAFGSAPERRRASATSSSTATGSATTCSGSAASRCTPLRSTAFPAPSTNLSARDCVIGASSSASALELGALESPGIVKIRLPPPPRHMPDHFE